MIPVLADLLPNVNELFEYKGFFGQHEWYEFNKTALMAFISTLICIGLFYVGSRKRAMVPGGLQNVAEMGYETVEQQIAVEVMGPENGKKWTPFLEKPVPKDDYGNEWGYRQKSEHGNEDSYDLWSYGKDKQEGTADDIVSCDKEADSNGSSSPSSTGSKGSGKGG